MQNGALCVIFAGPAGTVAPFYNMDLTDKSWIVHLYPALMECGDGMFIVQTPRSEASCECETGYG